MLYKRTLEQMKKIEWSPWPPLGITDEKLQGMTNRTATGDMATWDVATAGRRASAMATWHGGEKGVAHNATPLQSHPSAKDINTGTAACRRTVAEKEL
jgi:hypothetical protein